VKQATGLDERMRLAVTRLEPSEQVEPCIGIPVPGQNVETASEIEWGAGCAELQVAIDAQQVPAVHEVIIERRVELDRVAERQMQLCAERSFFHVEIVAAAQPDMRALRLGTCDASRAHQQCDCRQDTSNHGSILRLWCDSQYPEDRANVRAVPFSGR